VDRLGNLGWAGKPDMGWFEVGPAPDPVVPTELTPAQIAQNTIDHLLSESLPMVAADNTQLTKGQRAKWIEYRTALRNLSLSPDFPNNIYWPARPE
jgi:hypothetical protein